MIWIEDVISVSTFQLVPNSRANYFVMVPARTENAKRVENDLPNEEKENKIIMKILDIKI